MSGSSNGAGPWSRHDVESGELSFVSVRVRDDVVWREIEEEIVLLDLAGAAYFSLGGSGMTLWPALVEGTTLAALSDALARRFALDRAVAERDVRTFVNALGEQGLLDLERIG